MARVGIAGNTSWGTTLAILAARSGHDVTIWARRPDDASLLQAARRNDRFLPGLDFPDGLTVTASTDEAFGRADLALIAVPSSSVVQNSNAIARSLPGGTIVISATKGIDQATGNRMSQIAGTALGRADIGALSGPNLALEIAEGKPATTTVAHVDESAAIAVQGILNSSVFRVYTSSDLVGVELGGALKNIIAIGAGFIDGYGLGNNGKSAFVTRGLAEITRLGVAMGARAETFAGLSGMGDLVATCYSDLSRNRYVGQQLAKGRSAAEIVGGMDQVAEGVMTTRAAVAVADSLGVDMPIASVTRAVLAGELDPQSAVEGLMRRTPVSETESPR
ncbi:MAG TPA: NAD(P)H-dependent glycerol-3-phosphate dehydrogenase [Dehalococcoidia bacterium]|jgi:glycerol-3-phosphate dehydrogenase (NAD(P)+)|nr:glycerol-3-phosphate dehydrogenase [Chloroflexota bacterium]MDP5878046.1 NAD(P)H-dependent glycerol-3-phosphate dehydrogenase [Dehalococcoidia bacterium]MDP7161310.1 NAD(P)H-dependent glycerol-3-phosphate dehydrogenase [Dehalococcoidia bacterium]MDP7214201.1 NAD(P)H-dependent glycerol-3-phosphate dehydrogenase [Dehalococcoidia bacterium]MDP7515123.1 NAD(P)H-dependent glycerol-3-phosphate dehydrogenase [Dehalococcoidia bacterium]|tara:strand:- start:1027 stop:2031 length:1005 start_codon:yes stop_codon:yes gene_type:complete